MFFFLFELICFPDIGNERANAAKFLEEYGCGQVDPTSKEFVEKYLSTFTGDYNQGGRNQSNIRRGQIGKRSLI